MANGGARAATARIWDRIGVYVLLLVVPVIFMGVGWWESGRAARSLRTYTSAARELPQIREEVRAAARSDPNAMLRFGSGPDARAEPASMALAELDEVVPVAKRGAAISRLRRPLPWLAMAGGAIALVAGAIGLAVASQAGRAARASRDELIRSFSRVHRLLPFAMAGVLVGLAAGLVGIAVFETVSMWFADTISTGAFKLLLLGLMFAGLAVYGAFVAIRGLRGVLAIGSPEPFDEEAREVTEPQAPALWAMVRDVAARERALMPDAIAVGLSGGFYVTEHPVRLQPEGRVLDGRTLHLPAPYLELLDRDEVVSVVGHELGHFVGEDTAYSRHFSPIYRGLEQALRALATGTAENARLNPAFQLGAFTLDRFDQAVKHWGRLREFEADRLSMEATGARPVATSLLRTGVIAPVVDYVLERSFGEPPQAADLVGTMADTVREKGWPEMTEHLDRRAAHPTDTHPSTPHRIEKLGLAIDDGLVAAATRPPADPADTPGVTLFVDWLATRRTLSDDFLARARSAHASHRAALESAAAAVGTTESVELFENVKPMMWLSGIACALFLAGLVAVLVLAGPTGIDGSWTGVALLGGLCLAIAACFGGFWALLRARGRRPILVLGADTVVSPRLAAPIRWLDIDAYGVSAGTKLQIAFVMTEDAPLPAKVGWSPRTKVNRRRRRLDLQCYGIVGMRRTQPIGELIDRYLCAARARAALAGDVPADSLVYIAGKGTLPLNPEPAAAADPA